MTEALSRGPLGLHVAISRLLRRALLDEGCHSPAKAAEVVTSSYGDRVRAIVLEATGRRLRNVQEATVADLESVVAHLAQRTSSILTRGHHQHPAGWQEAERLGLALATEHARR